MTTILVLAVLAGSAQAVIFIHNGLAFERPERESPADMTFSSNGGTT